MNAPKLRLFSRDVNNNVEWHKVTLQELTLEAYQGLNTTSDLKYVENGIPFLQAKHITNGIIDKDDIRYLDSDLYSKNRFKYTPRKNNILFTNRGTIGKTIYIENDCDFMIAWNIMLIGVDEKKIYPYLLFVILSNLEKKGFFESLQTGNATKFIKKENLLDIKLAIPSNQVEQIKLATFVKLLIRKIEKQQEKIELLKMQKKGLMQKIFSQELRFRDENGQDYPEWRVVSLDSVANINPKSDPLNDSFQYIDLESVVKGQLKSSNFIEKQNAPSRAQRVVKSGDILYQTVRPYQKNNLYFNQEIEEQVVASTGYAQIRVSKSILDTYLYQYLNTERFTYRILKSCTGTSYPAISSSDLSALEIHLPHLKEQKKIALLFNTLDNRIQEESKKFQLLDIQKQAFMQQMFI